MARVPGAEAVYEVANLFRQRCLVESRSLLWPEEHIWTVGNLDALWAAFAEHPDVSNRGFFEKWEDQLASEPVAVHQLAADLMVVYSLFPIVSTLGAARKAEYISIVRGWKGLPQPDAGAWEMVGRAFEAGVATAGIYYLTGMPYHVAFYLHFSREAMRAGVDLRDNGAVAELADATRTFIMGLPEFKGDTIAGRNILLHLLFPDEYEPWASQANKVQIVRSLSEVAGVLPNADVDEALKTIREHLTVTLGKEQFNFWDDDVRPLWDKPASPPSPGKVASIKGTGDVTAEGAQGSSLQDLAHATLLGEAMLTDIHELLEERKQLIFEGPPGSGKTYVADKVARWFSGNPFEGDTDHRVELVQFHQSYDYEDFVQGIRPVTNATGQLAYEVRDGIFKQLCDRAAERPDERFVLIVDEINRGNISRIFGELLLLLEYRDQKARLPYATDADPYLRIPPNLYVIGTMNTADRSLAQIDYALRRRFYFVRFLPVVDGHAEILERWLATQQIDDDSRRYVLRLFIALNERIAAELSDDFQVGHSYFMQEDIGTRSRLDRIWDRAITPLLEEYFHHHRQREDILAGLAPDALVPSTPNAGAVETASRASE